MQTMWLGRCHPGGKNEEECLDVAGAWLTTRAPTGGTSPASPVETLKDPSQLPRAATLSALHSRSRTLLAPIMSVLVRYPGFSQRRKKKLNTTHLHHP